MLQVYDKIDTEIADELNIIVENSSSLFINKTTNY